jgi:hypothetical protein
MILKRPTLPTGHVVPGLPPITRALHCDEHAELYALDVDGQGTESLLLVRGGGTDEAAAKLQDWLGKQNPCVLLSYRPVEQRQLGGAVIGATFLTAGSRLVAHAFAQAPKEALCDLLLGMLDCVESGALAGQFPSFDPDLCWLDAQGRGLVCVCPRAGPIPGEAEQVSLVAAAFYRIAAGMEPRSTAGMTSPIEKWCRYAGSDLSKLIARCLAPAADPSRFASLAEVRHALGRSGSIDDAGSNTPSNEGGELGLANGHQHGLARVAGMHRLKALLQREVVEPLRSPEPFKRYGLTIPNGVLLYGPPGCGKTYIARQLAEELGYYFVEIIPSELASPFIHQSVMRIRELFDEAEAHSPAVIFIDEFEAMAPSRSDLGAHQQYKSEEVNEFLAHLNSCAEKRIFVIAATNQPEKIDSAVRRTGRLDKLIYVGPPDDEARQEMLAMHLQGRPVALTLELAPLSRALVGYSASDLKFLVDEAARHAFMNKTDIGEDDFSVAVAKIRPSVPEELADKYRSIEERG